MEINISTIEIAKLNLEPTDHLVVKISGPEFGEPEVLSSLSTALKKRFPNNQIMVFYIPEGNTMEFQVVKEANGNVLDNPLVAKNPIDLSGDCSQPTSYCNDCGCGKKERILGNK